jgi:hypothetical protein
MANHIGTRLSRLIKERAYTAGHCVLLRSRLDKLKKEASLCAKEIKLASAMIAKLDQKITSASAIDTSQIRSIRPTPRSPNSQHGAFRRELVRVLKKAGGPVQIGELVKHMAEVFDLPMDTQDERVSARDAVRRPLNLFRLKGAVIRLPSRPGSQEGMWCWAENYVAEIDGVA